jgi:hypothetical protein
MLRLTPLFFCLSCCAQLLVDEDAKNSQEPSVSVPSLDCESKKGAVATDKTAKVQSSGKRTSGRLGSPVRCLHPSSAGEVPWMPERDLAAGRVPRMPERELAVGDA